MRILSIGNSFSQDAHAYLHDAARSLGVELECRNLYIGGCSLERHACNLASGEAAYTLQINGRAEETPVSLGETLRGGRYDMVTLQQSSPLSGFPETFHPYIDALYAAVREAQPEARVYLHETWAYETDSTHSAFAQYGSSQTRMADQVQEAYARIAAELGLPCIPVGRVVRYFRESVPGYAVAQGGRRLTRDGYHLSIPLGRLLAALVWIEALAGRDVSGIGYVPPEASEEEARCVPELSEAVHRYMAQSR